MKKLTALLSLLFVLAFSSAAFAYEVHDGPTGVIKYAKGKTYDGYTIITPSPSGDTHITYLINMEGDIVHTWDTSGAGREFPFVSQLLPSGNLLVYTALSKSPVGIGGYTGLLEELDWDGKVVWSYEMCTENEVSHHAFDRMPNGNTLILGWEKVSAAEMAKKGRNPGTFPESVMMGGKPLTDFWVDFVREVDRDGKTVWEWHVMDHVGTGSKQFDPNYILPEKVGLPYASYDWTHFNTCQYIPETDQIILNSRNFSETYIIDKKTGAMVFRWGNPSAYGQGARPAWYDNGDQQIFGSHHAAPIGNGVVSIFDNGSERAEGQRSRVVEVDTKTGDVVWEYHAMGYNSFFSYRQGGAQKLPNGNYLVTSSQQGHLFEVTLAKEVVWEFVNPLMDGKSAGIFSDRADVLMAGGNPVKNMFNNMIHRAYRYGADYPGLQGKDLTPKGHIVKGYPKFLDVWQPL